MKRGLIFDLDGTLVDSLPGIAASLNHGLAACGYPAHDQADVRRFIGNGTLELSRRALPAGVSIDRAVEVEAALKQHYDRHWPEGTHPYAGAGECVAGLEAAGFRIAVLSNKTHEFTVEIVARLFPGVPFDPVFGQRPGVARKPDPEAALLIAKGWGLEPGSCIFVGDSVVDLETASRAAMVFQGVAWGYNDPSQLEEAGASGLASSMEDLDRKIRAL